MRDDYIEKIVREFEHAPSSDDLYESWYDRCVDEAIEAWHARAERKRNEG